MSHDILNEQIAIIGRCVLHLLLKNMKACSQLVFHQIAAKATDVIAI